MKKLLLIAPAILALGFAANAEEAPVPPPAEAPGSVQETKASTFAVVIEVLGALPPPTEYAKARDNAIRVMEARGLILTDNPDLANCLVTVVFEPNGSRRMIINLEREASALPADSDSVDGDDTAAMPEPDAGPADDEADGCYFDGGGWPFWPVGLWAPIGFVGHHPGREAFRGSYPRDHRRESPGSPRPLPTERRGFSGMPSRTLPSRPSGWVNHPSGAPRTGGRTFAPSQSRSWSPARSAPPASQPSASSSASRSAGSGRR